MRDLSSRWTYYYKVVLPALWIGGFVLATASLFMIPPEAVQGGDPRDDRWLFLGATCVGSAFLYWFCIPVKRVRLRDDTLLISNYRREVEVPLRDVERVRS